jgi:hypothetical protein
MIIKDQIPNPSSDLEVVKRLEIAANYRRIRNIAFLEFGLTAALAIDNIQGQRTFMIGAAVVCLTNTVLMGANEIYNTIIAEKPIYDPLASNVEDTHAAVQAMKDSAEILACQGEDNTELAYIFVTPDPGSSLLP